MAAHSVRLLGAKLWQPDESPHSNGLVAKEQKWLKTKGRNSWGWMSGDKCISTSWHFHHHLIDHLWDILNAETCADVCARLCGRVCFAESTHERVHVLKYWRMLLLLLHFLVTLSTDLLSFRFTSTLFQLFLDHTWSFAPVDLLPPTSTERWLLRPTLTSIWAQQISNTSQNLWPDGQKSICLCIRSRRGSLSHI